MQCLSNFSKQLPVYEHKVDGFLRFKCLGFAIFEMYSERSRPSPAAGPQCVKQQGNIRDLCNINCSQKLTESSPAEKKAKLLDLLSCTTTKYHKITPNPPWRTPHASGAKSVGFETPGTVGCRNDSYICINICIDDDDDDDDDDDGLGLMMMMMMMIVYYVCTLQER